MRPKISEKIKKALRELSRQDPLDEGLRNLVFDVEYLEEKVEILSNAIVDRFLADNAG